jgi:hypothetical protein
MVRFFPSYLNSFLPLTSMLVVAFPPHFGVRRCLQHHRSRPSTTRIRPNLAVCWCLVDSFSSIVVRTGEARKQLLDLRVLCHDILCWWSGLQ